MTRSRQITVYWSTTGQSCHAAKEFLSSQGIAFVAKNVAEDAAARAELMAKTGRMAVPVITVDGEVIVGFDRGRLKRLLGVGSPGRLAVLTAASRSSCQPAPDPALFLIARTARATPFECSRRVDSGRPLSRIGGAVRTANGRGRSPRRPGLETGSNAAAGSTASPSSTAPTRPRRYRWRWRSKPGN